MDDQPPARGNGSDKSQESRREAEQALADREQALGARDQQLSDRDQRASDADQRSADWDRDYGGDPQAHQWSTTARAETARARKENAHLRELTAEDRNGLARLRGETHTLEVPPGYPLSGVRDFLRSVDGHLPHRVREDLALLATELVSNAQRHGQPPVVLEITWLAGTARLTVGGGGDAFRWEGRRPGPDQGGGWGMTFVDVIADRWGIYRRLVAGENRVWLEVDH
jgi:hypothetical protein